MGKWRSPRLTDMTQIDKERSKRVKNDLCNPLSIVKGDLEQYPLATALVLRLGRLQKDPVHHRSPTDMTRPRPGSSKHSEWLRRCQSRSPSQRRPETRPLARGHVDLVHLKGSSGPCGCAFHPRHHFINSSADLSYLFLDPDCKSCEG